MKSNLKTIVLLSLGLILAHSCKDKCEKTRTYWDYVPKYKPIEDIRNSFEVAGPKSMADPGKIYVYQDYLFVVDEYSGFHVLNNENPSNPEKLSFVQLEACTDLSVKNGIIYANQGPDIVVLNLNGGTDITYQSRMRNAMNTHLYMDGEYPSRYDFEKVVEVVDEDCGSSGGGFRGGVVFSAEDAMNPSNNAGGGTGGGSGTGGSMARFKIIGDYMFIVGMNEITSVDISNPNNLTEIETIQRQGLETIFGVRDNLFIGTTTGMLIYKVNSSGVPEYVSEFTHARGCDPVVVEGDYAYVTLRGTGTNCGEADDELHVLDISDLYNPKLLESYAMEEPYGLGIRDGILAVCDGNAGLKVYNAQDPYTISRNLLTTIEGNTTYDVILMEDFLILTTKQGVFQYDYSDPSNLVLLSKIYGE
jgi:hypothetical protein